MQLKNDKLFDIEFSEALKRLAKMPLPFVDAIQLAKTIKVVDSEREIVNEIRVRLLNEYGVTGMKNGEPVMKNGGDKEMFLKKIKELSHLTFEIPLKRKITLQNDTRISANQLLALEDIINFDDK